MHKLVTATVPAVLVAALLAAAPGNASPANGANRRVTAHAASTKCNLQGKEERLGPTYVTALSVSGGASCHQATTLVHSYYKCRLAHGGKKGRCSAVEGFRCTEKRLQEITVQFAARVTCTRGREVIRHEFTQFT